MGGGVPPLPDLTHEDVEDPCGDGQREGGEEDGEEPGGGVHGGVKALSLEMHVQLWKLFLQGPKKKINQFHIVTTALENHHHPTQQCH